MKFNNIKMFGKKIVFYLTLGLIGLMKITPFYIIYIISDFIYVILYYITAYRKEVVISNLQKAFPEKSSLEIKKITQKFYKNLSDIFAESIKGFAMSDKQMLRRFKTENPETANKYSNEGKDVIILASHYANWEWAAVACGTDFKHHAAVLYKPLSNVFFDTYIKNKRARFGIDMVSIYETRKYFNLPKQKPTAYIMVADQNPSNPKKAVWVDFFNRKTAFLHGPEEYAKEFNMPVLYFDVQRVKRGFYTMKVIELTPKYTDIKKDGLTKIYAETIEEIIRKKPENWLWSHKRWKHRWQPEVDKVGQTED